MNIKNEMLSLFLSDFYWFQLDVYNRVAAPIVNKTLAGYNGTILVYGQTGTGKTYTMEGIHNDPALRGIIPNSFIHIFSHIAQAKEDTTYVYSSG